MTPRQVCRFTASRSSTCQPAAIKAVWMRSRASLSGVSSEPIEVNVRRTPISREEADCDGLQARASRECLGGEALSYCVSNAFSLSFRTRSSGVTAVASIHF
jgi:hypothetical protein